LRVKDPGSQPTAAIRAMRAMLRAPMDWAGPPHRPGLRAAPTGAGLRDQVRRKPVTEQAIRRWFHGKQDRIGVRVGRMVGWTAPSATMGRAAPAWKEGHPGR
jgi:hypothetical protein